MTFDEGLAMLDAEVEPKCQRRLRSMIRDAASKQAAIRFDEGGVDGRSAELQSRGTKRAFLSPKTLRDWFDEHVIGTGCFNSTSTCTPFFATP